MSTDHVTDHTSEGFQTLLELVVSVWHVIDACLGMLVFCLRSDPMKPQNGFSIRLDHKDDGNFFKP